MLCHFPRKQYGDKFPNSDKPSKVSWTLISKEFNKEIEQLCFYKTEKQCRERWFNHLSPFLNK